MPLAAWVCPGAIQWAAVLARAKASYGLDRAARFSEVDGVSYHSNDSRHRLGKAISLHKVGRVDPSWSPRRCTSHDKPHGKFVLCKGSCVCFTLGVTSKAHAGYVAARVRVGVCAHRPYGRCKLCRAAAGTGRKALYLVRPHPSAAAPEMFSFYVLVNQPFQQRVVAISASRMQILHLYLWMGTWLGHELVSSRHSQSPHQICIAKPQGPQGLGMTTCCCTAMACCTPTAELWVVYCRRYCGLSVEGSTNPFPAAFLDLQATVQLVPITMSAQTCMSWSAEFSTAPEVLPCSQHDLWLASTTAEHACCCACAYFCKGLTSSTMMTSSATQSANRPYVIYLQARICIPPHSLTMQATQEMEAVISHWISCCLEGMAQACRSLSRLPSLDVLHPELQFHKAIGQTSGGQQDRAVLPGPDLRRLSSHQLHHSESSSQEQQEQEWRLSISSDGEAAVRLQG